GTLVLDLDFKFNAWEQREKRLCALLEFAGTMQSKAGETNTAMGGTMSIDHGTITGKVWFDPALGMAVESATDQILTMRMDFQGRGGGDGGPGGGTMTNIMNQKVTVKLAELTSAGK